MPYKDKIKQLEYQRQWMQKRRNSFFVDKTCIECDSTEKLELDHVDPKTKIDHRIWSWSETRRLEEIAKCQILCQTCHKKKNIKQIKANIPEHGTYSYKHKKCRCNICVISYRDYNRETKAAWRAQNKLAWIPPRTE